jgi:hypothetical protein
MPDNSLPPADQAMLAFFEIVAFALGWSGVDRLLAGTSLFIVIPIFTATILTSYTGFKWTRIRAAIGPRFASAVERITGNRLYRRIIYSVIIIAVLVSVSYRVYHYYRNNLTANAKEPPKGVAAATQNDPSPTPQNTQSQQASPQQEQNAPTKPMKPKKQRKAAPTTTPTSTATPATTTPVLSPVPPTAVPSTSQQCAPGAYCAQSIGQQGGITGQVFIGNQPPRFEQSVVSENVKQGESLYETTFKVRVTTTQAIVFHVKAGAPSIRDGILIDDADGPWPHSMSSQGYGSITKPGWTQMNFINIEAGTYLITVRTSAPEKVELSCW